MQPRWKGDKLFQNLGELRSEHKVHLRASQVAGNHEGDEKVYESHKQPDRHILKILLFDIKFSLRIMT